MRATQIFDLVAPSRLSLLKAHIAHLRLRRRERNTRNVLSGYCTSSVRDLLAPSFDKVQWLTAQPSAGLYQDKLESRASQGEEARLDPKLCEELHIPFLHIFVHHGSRVHRLSLMPSLHLQGI